jgi:hypothetical protein
MLVNMEKIKDFLRDIFAPRVTYYYKEIKIDENSKEAKKMSGIFKAMDGVFEQMDKVFKEMHNIFKI